MMLCVLHASPSERVDPTDTIIYMSRGYKPVKSITAAENKSSFDPSDLKTQPLRDIKH